MPRKSKFTDEQIIRALREIDGGAKQSDVARRLADNDRNGTILGAATIRPIGQLGQNATNSRGHQHSRHLR